MNAEKVFQNETKASLPTTFKLTDLSRARDKVWRGEILMYGEVMTVMYIPSTELPQLIEDWGGAELVQEMLNFKEDPYTYLCEKWFTITDEGDQVIFIN